MNNNTNIIKGKNYRITILSEILIRLEYNQSGNFLDDYTEFARNRDFPIPQFKIQQDDKYLIIETSHFKLEYAKEKNFIGSKIVPEQNLKVNLLGTDKYWFFNHVEARNYKTIGHSIDDIESIKLENKGLYSTDGFVSIDDTKSLILKENKLFKRSEKSIDTYLFMYKRDFGLVLRDYFILTGKPKMVPRYFFGNIWNKNSEYTDYNVEELIEKFNKYNIPISAIILGDKWHLENNQKYGLTWNNNLFINYYNFVNYLKKKNIYLGVTINPIIISDKEKNFTKFIEETNQEKKEKILLNIYNKEIMDSYLNNFIEELVNNGVSSFIIDYKDKDLNVLRTLNYYHSLYFEKKNLKNPIFSRNGLINTHSLNTVYTGNTLVSWKVLNNLPEYVTSGSNNGISFISSDIGGFYGGIEDDDLFRRYVQFGTFSSIMRLSSDKSHYYKREPWNWDKHTLNIVTEYLRLRSSLIPYLYTEANNYHETGLPIIQPVYYKYPEIYDEPDYKNEYYFGRSLFVCPITKPKDYVMDRTIQKMFLPEGTWYDFKTGIKYIGNKRYITFYKDEDYPIFATQGSIIPLAILDEENINNSNNPNGFEIHIFPGKSNQYTIYEDDGITTFENKYVKTTIDYNYMLNNYTVIIKPEIKDYSIIPNKRTYKIKFRNTRKPNDVIVYIGEEKLENVKYYIKDADFIIEIDNIISHKQITINCKGQDIEIDSTRIVNNDIDSIISGLKIKTSLKQEVNKIMFSNDNIKRKRINIRKLKRKGLELKHVNVFLKLLEYLEENI